MRLNLGCGNAHIDGFLNVDKEASCRPDKIQDLENILLLLVIEDLLKKDRL